MYRCRWTERQYIYKIYFTLPRKSVPYRLKIWRNIQEMRDDEKSLVLSSYLYRNHDTIIKVEPVML